MKKYIFLATLFISIQLSAQDMPMFDSLKVNGNTKLIGRYPQFDKEKVFKDWNFYIDDPVAIKKTLLELTVGKEVTNSIEELSFSIALIQDNKETTYWIVNPTLKSALYRGHTYKFDTTKLKELGKAYPFDYRYEKIIFKNQEEYNNYLAKQKLDKTFLFDYSPNFKYEGDFEVQFPKNFTFRSPKAISDYLTPLIEKIVEKDSYSVSYRLSGKNLTDHDQFTMTITGSKKLFDSLQLYDLQKENWKPTIERGLFFYRTK